MEAKKLFTIYLGLSQPERIKFQFMVQKQNQIDTDEIFQQKKELVKELSKDNPFIEEWLERVILHNRRS